MSKATKCDRCGGFYEQGGKNVRQGWGSMSDEYDLCPDCAGSFDAWLERGQMADTSERVTNDGEMLHDTREKLEADVRCLLMMFSGHCRSRAQDGEFDVDERLGTVNSWFGSFVNALDRQAAITERECMERSTSERIGFDCAECAEGLGRELEARCYHLKARIAELKAKLDAEAQHAREAWQLWGEADARAEQMETERDELQREIATLKEHRAANMERLHELTDTNMEMAWRIQQLEKEVSR